MQLDGVHSTKLPFNAALLYSAQTKGHAVQENHRSQREARQRWREGCTHRGRPSWPSERRRASLHSDTLRTMGRQTTTCGEIAETGALRTGCTAHAPLQRHLYRNIQDAQLWEGPRHDCKLSVSKVFPLSKTKDLARHVQLVLCRLISLKNTISKQLPNMPKEYIARLVMDRRHRSCAIVAKSGTVLGGITYRPFHAQVCPSTLTCCQNMKGPFMPGSKSLPSKKPRWSTCGIPDRVQLPHQQAFPSSALQVASEADVADWLGMVETLMQWSWKHRRALVRLRFVRSLQWSR